MAAAHSGYESTAPPARAVAEALRPERKGVSLPPSVMAAQDPVPRKGQLSKVKPVFVDAEGRKYFDALRSSIGTLRDWVLDKQKSLRSGECLFWVTLPRKTKSDPIGLGVPTTGEVITAELSHLRFSVTEHSFGSVAPYKAKRSGWIVLKGLP